MKRLVIQSVFLMLLFLYGCKNYNIHTDENCTAILGAFDEEIRYLEGQMSEKNEICLEGIRFVKGVLHNTPVVIGISGMGKVNASMTTTLMIHHFQPEQVIFTGIAGGLNPEIQPGDIIIGWKTVQHDLEFITKDTIVPFLSQNPATGEENPVYYFADSLLLDVALQTASSITLHDMPCDSGFRQPVVRMGIIATGDAFIASTEKKEDIILRFKADAVEMEGAAVAQVCHQFGIPCIVIRSISDRADDEATETIEQFYKIAAQNSAILVMAMMKEL